MNRDRIRKIALLGLLVFALAAFAYFGMIRCQPRRETKMGTVAEKKDVYYCPMHPTYRSDKPGNCPICSMKLVKLEGPGASTTADPTMKTEPSAAAAPTSTPVSQDNAIFVPP